MSKKRVHEIAKEQGLSSKELLEKLHAAGIEAKAAASSVEEALALKALGGGSPTPAATNGAAPRRHGERAREAVPAPAAKPATPPPATRAGGRRRVNAACRGNAGCPERACAGRAADVRHGPPRRPPPAPRPTPRRKPAASACARRATRARASARPATSAPAGAAAS